MRSAPLISFFSLTTTGALALPGCAPKGSSQPTPEAVSRPRVIGVVAVVDEVRRFVLIDLEFNLYVPSPGTKLQTKNAAGETAHLKASPEQKRPFIAAEIIDGNPLVGDEAIR